MKPASNRPRGGGARTSVNSRGKKGKGKQNAKAVHLDSGNVDNPNVKAMLTNLVNSQFAQLLTSHADDSGSEDMDVAFTPCASTSRQPASNPQQTTAPKAYKSQVVILEGVDDKLKKHPARLSKAIKEVKPQLEINKIRITASNAVLIEPKHPKDCCSLLKENAFPPNSALGPDVKARLPRENTVTHQVVILGLDVEITDKEITDMLDLQELPHNGVRRIKSREKNKATELVRLFLKTEEKKKQLLRHGLYLDQMHFKCVAAKEDEEKKLTFQCYNCQAWGDHKTWQCEKETKCVICGGPHRKADCEKTKSEAICCNCGQNHAAWSTACKSYKDSVEKRSSGKSYSAVTKTITEPSLLHGQILSVVHEVLTNLKKQIAVIVGEVVTKALLEHTYYEGESKRTNGKTYLGATARTKSIAKMAATAVNARPFFDSDISQVCTEDVGRLVQERLSSSFQHNATGPSTTSQ